MFTFNFAKFTNYMLYEIDCYNLIFILYGD